MSYVLTVVHNGNLEHVNLFAGFQTASKAALLWAKAYVLKADLVDANPEQEKGEDVVIWRFVDTNKTQVTVRFLTHVESSHIPYIKGPSSWQAVQVMAPPPAPAVPPPSLSKDDPQADHLPGGWSYPDKRPLTMKDLKAGADAIMASELTEDQKWALVTARVAKRPNCLFLLTPYGGSGLYSQKYALEELKNRTTSGLIIRTMELENLALFIGSEEESEDPQAYDYDDSSSSDDLDY